MSNCAYTFSNSSISFSGFTEELKKVSFSFGPTIINPLESSVTRYSCCLADVILVLSVCIYSDFFSSTV
ncbi:hypothetical protein KKC67_00945 [Patescibacteria group bacterium]|nr:hypothetical protein [Patescibacteria group bacterium]MBU1063028.1 hypothetical protein [Patescibacteria group bacterium]MBU1783379.1 hypothetical protein [Patescibacteria group bacterium]MBU1991563.1 hypothetical protein [Patescibacteria group bacterium]